MCRKLAVGRWVGLDKEAGFDEYMLYKGAEMSYLDTLIHNINVLSKIKRKNYFFKKTTKI